MMGPSAPVEPPLPIVTALVIIFSIADSGLTNPLERMTDSITSTTPCPSRACMIFWLINPTSSPPPAGKMISSGSARP